MGWVTVPRFFVRPRPALGLGNYASVPALGQGLGRSLGQGLAVEQKIIPDGDKGTKATLVEMAKLARAAGHDPRFVMWARGQVQDLPGKDYKGEAGRIFDIVKQHVRYVQDPAGLELVQDPRSVLFRDGSGDCDEHASTVAALAIALGHRAVFRTVGADRSRPDQWSHVYAMIGVQDRSAPDGVAWWAADTTQRSATLGWEPPEDRIWKKKDWLV
jgi:hypothetical protein